MFAECSMDTCNSEYLTSELPPYIRRFLESQRKAEPNIETENIQCLFSQPPLQVSKGMCPPIGYFHLKLQIRSSLGKFLGAKRRKKEANNSAVPQEFTKEIDIRDMS